MVSLTSNELNNTLFKKILLSMFPKNMPNTGIQPAGMFVSFISARQFFSLVNRKIIENYKLNLFDVALDPFEVKIGFGDKPMVKIKDIEPYYAYCSAANLNGNKFYNPSNIANVVTMLASMYFHEHFEEDEGMHFTQLMLSLYLFTFLMYARMKVFPYPTERQKNFNWFIDTFFNFYQVISTKTESPIKDKKLTGLKKALLKKIEVWFCLFAFYTKVNDALKTTFISNKECHTWLFHDEKKKSPYKDLMDEYIKLSPDLCRLSIFHPLEVILVDTLLPVDLLIRYVFNAQDGLLTARVLFPKVYDKHKCDDIIDSFLTSDDRIEELLQYLFSYTTLRDNFFTGMQKFILHRYKTDTSYNHKEEQEMNEFMSAVGDIESMTDMTGIPIPTKLKNESQTVEKLLNFYITLMGGFNVSRGDTGFVRLWRKDILSELVTEENLIGEQQDSLYYFGGLLYIYSKNIFYYKYAYDNIKAGKDKFSLPFRASMKEVYSNMFLIHLFDEQFISTILSDIVPSDTKIHVKTKSILTTCGSKFGSQISALVNADRTTFIHRIYEPITDLLRPRTPFASVITKYLTDDDLYWIRNRLYTLDFWIFRQVCCNLRDHIVEFQSGYSDMVILGILASAKETLFGFLLYLTYVATQKDTPDHLPETLIKTYCTSILLVADHYVPFLKGAILDVWVEYKDLLTQWIKLDDNPIFFQCSYDNLIAFAKGKTATELIEDVSGEDMIRWRGYLKNATYYNKRYIMPN